MMTQSTEKIKIIAVTGPTASGKTRLGVSLAERFSGEIISADSMQIYKGMNIATAKPSLEETRAVRHHLIDFLDPGESFSVSEFIRLANDAVNDIMSRNKFPILVGGTGLYADSFLSGRTFIESARDEDIRKTLGKRLKEQGALELLSELEKIDPETAASLHPNNTKRIIRALEMYMVTGKTLSEQNALSHRSPSRYDPLYIGITFRDREKLYKGIDRRVDEMLRRGLVDEAKEYYSKEKSVTAAAAIGYKELKPYLDGEKTLEECAHSLKTATRRYAKRQTTWFRRNEKIKWFYWDDYGCFSELENKACETVRKWLDEKE